MINPFNIIPTPYLSSVNIALKITLFIAVFWLGWLVNGWRLNLKYEKLIAEHTQELIDQIEEAQKQRDEAQQRVTVIDKKLTQERTYARKKIDELRDLIDDGSIRLSVPSSNCLQAADNSRGDSSASRCELDRSTAQALISITQKGDDAIQQLTACQSILRSLK